MPPAHFLHDPTKDAAMTSILPTAEQLKQQWATDPRWAGIQRGYSAEEVVRLRGTVAIEHSLARLGAEKLWKSLGTEPFVNALGALTGNQAMQQVKAGLKAIYLSGWQVAADANVAGEMYPDQSLYPANSVPLVVKRINNTLLRADQLHHAEGNDSIDFLQPIVADAEAGFGGVLNAFELMKAMIEAGAAGVHFEDQLASVKKCGHMGGKVLVPTQEAVQKLIAARLAADVMGVPTLLVARTDAEAADLITSDIDDNDKPFCTGERTVEGFFKTKPGLTLRSDFTLSDEEMNTYACPWHNNITTALVSFRTAKALKTNPGSRFDIHDFRWRNSTPFDWHSQQLMDLGLMEPGQWF